MGWNARILIERLGSGRGFPPVLPADFCYDSSAQLLEPDIVWAYRRCTSSIGLSPILDSRIQILRATNDDRRATTPQLAPLSDGAYGCIIPT
jgi:hypothetical protein